MRKIVSVVLAYIVRSFVYLLSLIGNEGEVQRVIDRVSASDLSCSIGNWKPKTADEDIPLSLLTKAKFWTSPSYQGLRDLLKSPALALDCAVDEHMGRLTLGAGQDRRECFLLDLSDPKAPVPTDILSLRSELTIIMMPDVPGVVPSLATFVGASYAVACPSTPPMFNR